MQSIEKTTLGRAVRNKSAAILRLAQAGVPARAIAAAVGSTQGAVYSRMSQMRAEGLLPPTGGGVARPIVVPLGIGAAEILALEAAARGCRPADLLARIAEAILRDGIVSAALGED
jgi:hypothetical protein